MDALNLISVSESASREMTAIGARLRVSISGQAFFTGSEALRKAAQVAALMAALKECDVPEEDIRLLDIVAENETGLLTKSSSATYELGIRCRTMESLGPVVNVVAAQKNSRISRIAWDYQDLSRIHQEVLQEAVLAAKSSADVIASALSVRLLGVHKLSYDVSGLDTDLNSRLPGLRRRHKANEFSDSSVGGLVFSHSTRLIISVVAEFLVETFPAP